jgi:hypothetical protein
MSSDRIDAERQAITSLMELYEQADKCRKLYERAELTLPEALQRFLGMSEQAAKQSVNRPMGNTVKIPEPAKKDGPDGANSDWVSIDAASASATAIALAVLRGAGAAVRPKDLFQRVTDVLPGVPSGTLANIGTRLGGDVIARGEDGWRLSKPEMAGILYAGRLWAPLSILTKQELAAHRREAIFHVLKHFPTGLQTVQLVEQLQNCEWVHAPVNKDLLKADMEALAQDGKVRRRGNSKKWEITSGEEGR